MIEQNEYETYRALYTELELLAAHSQIDSETGLLDFQTLADILGVDVRTVERNYVSAIAKLRANMTDEQEEKIREMLRPEPEVTNEDLDELITFWDTQVESAGYSYIDEDGEHE